MGIFPNENATAQHSLDTSNREIGLDSAVMSVKGFHKRTPLPAITGIRIFLALWVVVFHLYGEEPVFRRLVETSPTAVENVVVSGGCAVGVFFVLSGFVLAYNYDLSTVWGTQQRFNFWIARFARVYPVYVFALLLALPSLLAGLAKAGPLHAPHLIFAAFETLVLAQSWNPWDVAFWSGPAWSLSVEAFFYLTFPWLGIMLWKIDRRRFQIATLAALWLAACGVAYALAAWKTPWLLQPANTTRVPLVEFIRFNPLLRLPEFLAGIVLCKLFLTERARTRSSFREGRNGPPLYLAGLAFGAIVASCHNLVPSGFMSDELFMPASAAVILGLSFGGGPICRWLSTRSMVFFGQASYAVYLLHVALFSYFGAAAKRIHHTDTQQLLLDFLYLVSLLVLSSVVFVKLEEPARRAIIKHLRRGTVHPPLEVSAQPVSADPF